MGCATACRPRSISTAAGALHALVRDLVRGRVVDGVHDCSDGGLAVALAEMAIAGECGADVSLDVDLVPAVSWFSESASRVVLSVAARIARRRARPRRRCAACRRPTSEPPDGERLMSGDFDVALSDAADAWRNAIPRALGRCGRRREALIRDTGALMDPGIGHACGVFGVYTPGQSVAQTTYHGLYALQHRGQESAGIAVSDGQTITVVKDMGLVTQVFDERNLVPLDGHLAIGHVRYSTTGSSTWRNAQPVYREIGDAGFALGHNGNLTNTGVLAEQLGMLPGMLPADSRLDSTTDSALVAELIARAVASGAALRRSRPRARARTRPAAPRRWVLVRDDGRRAPYRRARPPRHLAARARPGREGLGARQRDVCSRHRRARTSYARSSRARCSSSTRRACTRSRFAEPDPKLCLFEFVYFARPDTMLYGKQRARRASADG